MAKIEQFKCDGCGKLRTEDVNHWWLVYVMRGSERGMQVQPISSADESELNESSHFCGQQCALAFISAQMAGGKG